MSNDTNAARVAALRNAERLLRETAQEYMEGISINGQPDWEHEPDTEAAYKEHIAAADALAALAAPQSAPAEPEVYEAKCPALDGGACTCAEGLGHVECLKQEAQIHAQEARTANATIAEIYQVCSGATGEQGNWHGAEPVRMRIAELEAKLTEAQKDAARYRWLRNFHAVEGGVRDELPYIAAGENYGGAWALHSEEADTAIDAAMARKEGGA